MTQRAPESTTILGKRWRLSYRPGRDEWGNCDPPGSTHKEIAIDGTLLHPDRDAELLTILIHEGLHAGLF